MTENPLVSCVIATKDRADLLENAIKSVAGQTYENLDILIIDDASTDNTRDIVMKYMGTDKRIRYVKNPVNIGCRQSKSSAAALIKGEYVAFLDDDDIWLKEKIEKQIKFADKYSMVSCVAMIKYPDKTVTQDLPSNGPLEVSFNDTFLGGGRYYYPSGVLIRREVIDGVEWLDEDYGGRDFFLKITQKYGPGLVLKEPLVVFNRAHDLDYVSRGNFPDKVMAIYEKWKDCFDSRTRRLHLANIYYKGALIGDTFSARISYLLKAVFMDNKKIFKILEYIKHEIKRFLKAFKK